RVALGAIDAVRERFGVTEEIIREGLRSIRRNTGIRGRFETVRTEPRMILDVAHNPDGARVMMESLRQATGGEPRVHFVYGAVQDKDVEEIVKILAPFAASLHAVRADNHRSLPAAEIAFHADSVGIPARVSGTVANGIDEALMAANEHSTIVICGSFYVVADAIEHLEGEIIPEIEKDNDRVYEGERGDPEYSPGSVTERQAEQISLPDVKPADREHHGETISPKHRPVKDWRASEQPRERLMTLGPRALSDSELLAILLRTGRKGEDVIQMSRNILHRFETIAGLSERDFRELEQVPGIGPAKAVTLAAAFEIGKRIKADPFATRTVISSPEDVARIYIPMLRGIQKEQFHVIILNSANQVLRMSLVSEGNLNSSIVHPREVYRTAIVENAASIIGLHNHPSGNPTPSKEDISITRQLVEAGRIIGIPFHDHIIIAGDEHVSLAERGYV
ncbi:MAG: DNA repair protein RadC, partial [Bacteroidota bacterium]